MKTVFAANITKDDKYLVVPFFKSDKSTKYPKEIDQTMKVQMKNKDFEGKKEETNFVYSPRKILLLGLGGKKKFNAAKAREIFAVAIKKIKSKKSNSVTIFALKELEKYGQEIGEGIGLANYTFAKFKTGKKAKEIEKGILTEVRVIGKLEGIQKGLTIASSVNYARDLVTGPANIVTAAYLANEAKKIAKINGYKIQVLDRKQIEKLKMGAILAVNSGSQKNDQQARFVVMEYNGAGKKENPIIIIGKGLIFDTGGLNLKPGQSILNMQQDMAGGAVCLGVFDLLKKLKIKKNVVGIIPITENLIDAYAFRPNDIITTYSGKTVEILNTDAEGRLILIDALTYGVKKFKPKYMIDIATLTGACMVALGDRYAGLFGNDKKLIELIGKSGERTDELTWHMPIHKDHKKIMESQIADLRNVEKGYIAGACTAAAFLENFVEKAKWAHLDIAGMAFTENPKKYEAQRATGYGIRLLIDFLENEK